MSDEEFSTWLNSRRAARMLTPNKKVQRKTIKGLASAWGLPIEAVMRGAATIGLVQRTIIEEALSGIK